MIKRSFGILEKLCESILLLICKCVNIEINQVQIDNTMQFIKFGIVGVTNTIVSYGVYALAILLFQNKNISYDYLVATIVSFIVSVFWSFLLNNHLVFSEGREERSWIKTLCKTYLAYAFSGLFLSSVLNWMWIDLFGVSKLIAPILNIFITVPINYLLNKLWAYKA